MMNAAFKQSRKKSGTQSLLTILRNAGKQQSESEKMFAELGWQDLPAELKFEIEDDVRGYLDELNGRYSSTCPYIQRRRESVDFWVRSYMEGICSLETAINSVKIQEL
jgi:ribosome modulation factor